MRAVLPWLVMLPLACGSSGPSPPHSSSPEDGVHYVPLQTFNVHYEGFDASPSRTASPAEIEQARARVEGSEREFLLHSFSSREFVFVVARYVPRPALANVYVVVERLRVSRTPASTSQLGLGEVTRAYEVGDGVIRAGMSMQEVEQRLGRPTSVVEFGPVGSARWTYPTRSLLFLEGRLASFGGPPARGTMP